MHVFHSLIDSTVPSSFRRGFHLKFELRKNDFRKCCFDYRFN